MRTALITLSFALLAGCGDKSDAGSGDDTGEDGDHDTDHGTDGDTDGGTDTDSDTDSGTDSDTDSDTDGGTDTDTQPFAPQDGHWTFTGGELIGDSCNYDGDVPAGSGDGMTLTGTGGMAFTMLMDGDTVTHSCTWAADQSFTCTPAYSETSLASEGLNNAYIEANLVFAGDFQATGLVAMTVQLDIDCGGDSFECDLAETFGDVSFPCQVQFSAFAQAD